MKMTVENVMQRRPKALGIWRENLKKRLKRSGAPVGFGGKGAENDPESRRSLPPFTGTETYAES